MVLPNNWPDYKSVTTLAEAVLELLPQFGGRPVRATSSGLPIAAGDTICFSDKTNSPPARTRLFIVTEQLACASIPTAHGATSVPFGTPGPGASARQPGGP